jgi:hypothetical protein
MRRLWVALARAEKELACHNRRPESEMEDHIEDIDYEYAAEWN